jgi:hypothetical protein
MKPSKAFIEHALAACIAAALIVIGEKVLGEGLGRDALFLLAGGFGAKPVLAVARSGKASAKLLPFIVFVITTFSCVPHGPIDWPRVVQCGPDISDIIGAVTRILLSDNHESDAATLSGRAKDELSGLARTHGPDTVLCVIERLVNDWTAPGAASDPTRALGAARGQAFLDEVGVDIVTGP